MLRALLMLSFVLCMLFSLQTERVSGEGVPFIARINLPALKAKLENNRGKVVILDFWLHN